MADQRGLCCSVCYNNFKSDEDQYVPRNLTCGHTYCTGCLTKLACQARNLGILSCPTCKVGTTLCRRFDGVRSLPKNFGVLEILEAKDEVQVDGIQSEKEKNKYLCPEHDEALKVYCYTDNCLICIYCQVYGKHAGHNCELATNIASSTREELRNLSKKLGDYYDIVKKAKSKVVETKDSILKTQQYLRNRITKHMGVLRTCMARRETMLKCEVDSKTSEKIRPMDAQESIMTEIMNKCDVVYSLIQKCQSNDTALVEEKNNIDRLADEVSSLMEKCELDPKACDNLTYYFEYDIACTLETKIGEIRMLKPGQKEEPFAGLYAHELSGKKETREAGSQTENWENDHPLFESLLHGLEEIVHTGLTAQSWEDRTALEPDETESSDNSLSASPSDEPGEPLSLNCSIDDNTDDHNGDDDDDDVAADDDDAGDAADEAADDADDVAADDDDAGEAADDADDGADDGAADDEETVGGEVLQTVPGAQRHSLFQSSEEETLHQPDESSLLNEVQKEIERLRLLGARGTWETERDRVLLSLPDQQQTSPQTFSLESNLPLHGQRLVTTDGLSLDSRRSTGQKVVRHSADKVAARSRRGRGEKKASNAIFRSKPNEEGTPWQCKQCTMLNGCQVLVCLGCDSLRDSDARDGRNVCPMCTLVNEPGKSKCELCDTDLLSHQGARASQAD